jgi:hypothetical protein
MATAKSKSLNSWASAPPVADPRDAVPRETADRTALPPAAPKVVVRKGVVPKGVAPRVIAVPMGLLPKDANGAVKAIGLPKTAAPRGKRTDP